LKTAALTFQEYSEFLQEIAQATASQLLSEFLLLCKAVTPAQYVLHAAVHLKNASVKLYKFLEVVRWLVLPSHCTRPSTGFNEMAAVMICTTVTSDT